MSAIPDDLIATPITPPPTAGKFFVIRPPRPMLARDADSMYWMSRYVERTEHIARVLLMNSNLLMDVGELAPNLQDKLWQGVLTIFRMLPPPDGEAPLAQRVIQFMTLNPDNTNSLINCLTRARENARGIRENISAEMWESLNTIYWSIRSEDPSAKFDDAPDAFFRNLMTGSMMFQGLTDQTLPHDQAWLFAQLGKYLERIDVTCRIIETKFEILRPIEKKLEAPIRNINWMAVLRSCCSIEAYRRRHIGDMDPLRVASFLILENNFPRSIRYCVRMAHEAIGSIRRDTNPRAIDPAERILGRLDAQLDYAEMNEILDKGLPAYLQSIQAAVAEAAFAVQKSYFLH